MRTGTDLTNGKIEDIKTEQRNRLKRFMNISAYRELHKRIYQTNLTLMNLHFLIM